MASVEERRQAYQKKMRELAVRRTRMTQLYNLLQKKKGMEARRKGRKLGKEEHLQHRKEVERIEHLIATKKKSYGISVIVDPQGLRNQIKKIKLAISKLDD